jgi:hypothetical protein
MQGYICVYHRRLPKAGELRKTRETAASDPVLIAFLKEYLQEDRFYGWGDDPSFFAARTFARDVRHASWGVCRPDVRRKLHFGDLIVFFCGKPRIEHPRIWDYYYIGFGTVRKTIDRWQLWTDAEFSAYRRFFNVLAEPVDGSLNQKETFHPYHKDWRKRLEAPYILFSPEPEGSHFNLDNPLCVATYDGAHIPEHWYSANSDTVGYLENLLFKERGISRRLRSSPTGYGHAPINLASRNGKNRPGRSLPELRQAILKISETVEMNNKHAQYPLSGTEEDNGES